MPADELSSIIGADQAVLVPCVHLVDSLGVLVAGTGWSIAERMRLAVVECICWDDRKKVVSEMLHSRTSLASKALVWYESHESMVLPSMG